MVHIGNSWDEILKDEFQKEYYLKLRQFLIKEYKSEVIYPNMYDIFNAFKATDYENTKVVILGQDPYHEKGQAHGLAFSVPSGVRQPPSLMNIFKELEYDLQIERPDTYEGNLMPWARQGVLLLNTSLTVRQHQAGSHRNKGWEQFTDEVISILARKKEPVAFILWGSNARSKIPIIKNISNHHKIIEGMHPSPLSAHRGFFRGRYFSKANEFLKQTGQAEINWDIRFTEKM